MVEESWTWVGVNPEKVPGGPAENGTHWTALRSSHYQQIEPMVSPGPSTSVNETLETIAAAPDDALSEEQVKSPAAVEVTPRVQANSNAHGCCELYQ